MQIWIKTQALQKITISWGNWDCKYCSAKSLTYKATPYKALQSQQESITWTESQCGHTKAGSFADGAAASLSHLSAGWLCCSKKSNGVSEERDKMTKAVAPTFLLRSKRNQAIVPLPAGHTGRHRDVMNGLKMRQSVCITSSQWVNRREGPEKQTWSPQWTKWKV